MRYLSLFSGIEAASVAWNPLGWQAIAFAEIENFPCAVLAHHYPNIPNLGDVTRFKDWPDATVDVLVGGSPCQAFSVAGLRKGLDDPRGNLTLTYLAVVERYRPRWMVWENVPGVLSIDAGRTFGAFLGALEELGYGVAYRVLDAQYFGVPQRRRRVFVVGHLGDWRYSAAVLFERNSLSWNPPPSREAREEDAATVTSGAPNGGAGKGARSGHGKDSLIVPVAGTLQSRERGGGGFGTDFEAAGGCIPVEGCWWDGCQVSQTLDAVLYKGQTMPEKNRFPAVLQQTCVTVSPTLRAGGNTTGGDRPPGTDVDTADSLITYGIPGNWIGRSPENGGNATKPMHDIAPCLTKTDQHGVAFAQNSSGEVRFQAGDGSIAGCLSSELGSQQQTYINKRMTVRRLTPRECERLQGFPDDYTKISQKTADGPRYKALGNSMAVPVMRWIGERIVAVDSI